MEVLFATKNPAKVKAYKEKLEKEEINIITLNDLSINLNVDENGKNAIENARIKAKAYYEETKMITIGMDDCLFIENITEDEQPGTHVRRVNGKELSEDEMIEYYISLSKKHGGKLTAKWVYGMAVYDGIEMNDYTWKREDFYIIDKPCEKRNPGYPLDSISINKNNKYLAELSEEEKNEDILKEEKEKVIKFLVKTLKNSEK